MKKEVYCVEVGVRLPKDHPEFDCYLVPKMDKEWGLYDENQTVEFDYQNALEYAKKYVQDGVVGTYAIICEDIFNLDEDDIKEIEETGYCEFIDPPSVETALFYQVKTETSIETIIDRGENEI